MPALAVKGSGTGRGVCGVIGTLGSNSTGKWIKQQADVGIVGAHLARKVMSEPTPGVRLERWAIQIFCRNAANARLVLYIDDVTVEGTIPPRWHAAATQHLLDWQLDFRPDSRYRRRSFRRHCRGIAPPWLRSAGRCQHRQPWTKFPFNLGRDHAGELLGQIRRDLETTLAVTAPSQPLPADTEAFLHDLRDTRLRTVAAGHPESWSIAEPNTALPRLRAEQPHYKLPDLAEKHHGRRFAGRADQAVCCAG